MKEEVILNVFADKNLRKPSLSHMYPFNKMDKSVQDQTVNDIKHTKDLVAHM